MIIDEFTVSNADDLTKAQAHLRATQLSSIQLTNLVNYVNSLDQVSAPNDNETDIFSNNNEPEVPDTEVDSDNEFCFPIPIKNTKREALICL